MFTHHFSRIVSLVTCLALFACTAETSTEWKKSLNARLAEFGHRNWILIADAAYPAYSAPGVEIILTSEDLLSVLKDTLKAIDKADHIRPVIYLDQELAHVADKDAPGIEKYRNKLEDICDDLDVHTVLHSDLLSRIDDSARTYKVLVLKTELLLPYTSVFIQLDCGYWNPQAEQSLRRSMQTGEKK